MGKGKCSDCPSRKFQEERISRFKYVKTVECRPAGVFGQRYGMLYVQVGPNYIGKKYRVIIEEVDDARG